jgi:hypothetical protein
MNDANRPTLKFHHVLPLAREKVHPARDLNAGFCRGLLATDESAVVGGIS